MRELLKPPTRISICYPSREFLIEKDRWITSVTLWNEGGSGLRVSSFLHDITKRIELGGLSFERVQSAHTGDECFDLPMSFSDGVDLEKVIVVEDGKRVEFGIRVTARNSDRIIILPNAMPYTLAIQSPGVSPRFFEPQYGFEDCEFENWICAD